MEGMGGVGWKGWEKGWEGWEWWCGSEGCYYAVGGSDAPQTLAGGGMGATRRSQSRERRIRSDRRGIERATPPGSAGRECPRHHCAAESQRPVAVGIHPHSAESTVGLWHCGAVAVTGGLDRSPRSREHCEALGLWRCGRRGWIDPIPAQWSACGAVAVVPQWTTPPQPHVRGRHGGDRSAARTAHETGPAAARGPLAPPRGGAAAAAALRTDSAPSGSSGSGASEGALREPPRGRRRLECSRASP